MQTQTWLKDSTTKLKNAGIATADLDAAILLELTLKKPREWVLAHPEKEIPPQVLGDLNNKLVQRVNRTPLAYITGAKEFYGRTFLVNKDVLIPRPESESLIELLKSVVNSFGTNTVIDIGTGSGCLAITAKLLFPDVHITAMDISSDALKIARKNARRHNTQIQFKQLDISSSLPRMPQTRPYILLANLPYVPNGMVTSAEITQEPKLALFSGIDGLRHYRTLWDQISTLKNQPSHVITESLQSQHTQLVALATKAGYELQQTDTLAQLFIRSTL